MIELEKLASAYRAVAAARREVIALLGSSLVVYDVGARSLLAKLHPKKDLKIENVARASFSPDDARLALTSVGGEVVVLDTERWEVCDRLGRVSARTSAAMFIHDGRLLYQSGEALVIRDPKTGAEERHELEMFAGKRDGALLLSSRARDRWVGKLVTPAPADNLPPETALIVVELGRVPAVRRVASIDVRTQLLAVRPDGEEIVSALGTRYELRSLRSGEVRETVGTTTNGLDLAAAWSPDGTRLALSDRESVTLFDPESMTELESIELADVRGITFSASGEHIVAAAGSGGTKSRLLRVARSES